MILEAPRFVTTYSVSKKWSLSADCIVGVLIRRLDLCIPLRIVTDHVFFFCIRIEYRSSFLFSRHSSSGLSNLKIRPVPLHPQRLANPGGDIVGQLPTAGNPTGHLRFSVRTAAGGVRVSELSGSGLN